MIIAFKRSNYRLLLTMILVSLLVTAVAIAVIYRNTMQSKKEYLKQLSDNEYAILMSVFSQNANRDQLLVKIAEQQHLHPGLGKTGEFLISVRQGDSVMLIFHSRIHEAVEPLSLPLTASKGEPGRFAAMGNNGYMKGIDYRGVKVLAYGQYIREIEWGIVAKIDYSEIIKPFWEASLLALLSSLLLVLAGIYLFKRFSDPLLESIRESEEKYHMLFELIPSGITIANSRGEIIESNKESEKLLGIPKDQHPMMRIDSDAWKIIRPDHSAMPTSEYASTIALQENRVVKNVKMGIVKDEESITWLSVAAAPFPVKDLGIIVVYSDITRQVEAEKQLKEHERQLEDYIEELNTLNDTKDKFFNIIAHDLKNPFGSLLGASEYLFKEIDRLDTSKAQKLSKILYNSAKNAFNILENLLDWSRSQTGSLNFNPKLINLFDVVDKNVQLAAIQAAEKNVEIQIQLDQGLECTADPNMLNTILRNLLTNALKFSHIGGKVIVAATRTPDEVVVEVQDNGTGIPEEDLDKLFRIDVKYVNTGTNNEKGTGLGLMLCKEFIDYHGGRIWVESQLNKGSKFFFSIPNPGTTLL
jgi:PAS domain S-box-containing protein